MPVCVQLVEHWRGQRRGYARATCSFENSGFILHSISQVVCGTVEPITLSPVKAAGTQQITPQIFEQCRAIFQTIIAVIVKVVLTSFVLERTASLSLTGWISKERPQWTQHCGDMLWSGVLPLTNIAFVESSMCSSCALVLFPSQWWSHHIYAAYAVLISWNRRRFHSTPNHLQDGV